MLRRFEGAWNFLHLEEQAIQRYERPKVIWEAVLQRPVAVLLAESRSPP
jgi:hypothetical protein